MGIFDFFKNIVNSLLIMILLAVISVFVISNTMQATLLDPDFYEEQFEKNNVYSLARGALLDQIAVDGGNATSESGEEAGQESFSADIMKAALEDALSDEYLKSESNKIIGRTLAYLKSESPSLELSISVRPRLVDSLTKAMAEDTGLPEEQLRPIVVQQLETAVPDPIDLDDLENVIKEGEARTWITLIISLTPQLLTIMLVLLAIIFVITLNVPHFAKIVGIPLILQGIGFAVLTYILPGTLSALPTADAVPVSLIQSIFEPILSSLFIQGIVLVVIGIGLLVLSFVYGMVAGKKR